MGKSTAAIQRAFLDKAEQAVNFIQGKIAVVVLKIGKDRKIVRLATSGDSKGSVRSSDRLRFGKQPIGSDFYCLGPRLVADDSSSRWRYLRRLPRNNFPDAVPLQEYASVEVVQHILVSGLIRRCTYQFESNNGCVAEEADINLFSGINRGRLDIGIRVLKTCHNFSFAAALAAPEHSMARQITVAI